MMIEVCKFLIIRGLVIVLALQCYWSVNLTRRNIYSKDVIMMVVMVTMIILCNRYLIPYHLSLEIAISGNKNVAIELT